MLSDKDMYQNDHYDKNYYDNYDELLEILGQVAGQFDLPEIV